MEFDDRKHADELSAEFCQKLDVGYSADDLLSVDFSAKELSKLGYSLSILFITPDEYMMRRQEFGYGVDPDTYEGLKAEGGVWSYQLKGRQYTTRGAHASPLLPRAWLAAAVALFNIIRINQEDSVKSTVS